MRQVIIVGSQDKAMVSRVVRCSQGGSMALLRWCSGGAVPLTLLGAAWSRRSVEVPTPPRSAPA